MLDKYFQLHQISLFTKYSIHLAKIVLDKYFYLRSKWSFSLFSKYFIYLIPVPTYGKPSKALLSCRCIFILSLDNTIQLCYLAYICRYDVTDLRIEMYDFYITFLASEVSSGANHGYLVRTLQRKQHQRPRAVVHRVHGSSQRQRRRWTTLPAAAETEANLGNYAVVQWEWHING